MADRQDDTILLVDSDQERARDLTKSLESREFSLGHAGSAEQAAALARSDCSIRLALVSVDAGRTLEPASVVEAVNAVRPIPVVLLLDAAEPDLPAGLESTSACTCLPRSVGDSVLAANLRMALRQGRTMQELVASERQFRSIVEHTADGVILTDHAGRIVVWNRGAEQITGFARVDVLGKPLWDIHYHMIPEERRSEETYRKFHDVVVRGLREGPTGLPNHPLEGRVQRADGSEHAVEQHVFAIPGERGYQVASITIDTTRRVQAEDENKRLLEEKELLLREVHHRIKNDMNLVCSLLSLQGSQSGNPNVRQSLEEATHRVALMSAIYESLYRGGDVRSVAVKPLVNTLLANLRNGFSHVPVELQVDVEDFRVPTRVSVPLGIILNEVVTNSMKYAFEGAEEAMIQVAARRLEDGSVSLSVKDNGVGVPNDVASGARQGFGLLLITALVQQHDGELTIENDRGTTITARLRVST
jgi:PAS domain S-box-containing protein